MHGKIVTDIEQSKILDEILPHESADMHHVLIDTCKDKYDIGIGKYIGILPSYPAWSLSALLDFLKQKYYVKLEHDGVSWCITCIEHDSQKKYTVSLFDDPIDACWGMILRLRKE